MNFCLAYRGYQTINYAFVRLFFNREGRVMGILEVSRSLGDGPYKRHGVTCVPDIKRCQLTDKDRWEMKL